MAVFNPDRMKPHVRKAIIWGGLPFIIGLVWAFYGMSNTLGYTATEEIVIPVTFGLICLAVGVSLSLVHTLIKWAFSG